jgi:hypothetical protein
MRATIRIDEGNDITGRVPHPEIARRTGSFTQQSRPRMIGYKFFGLGNRANFFAPMNSS